MLVVFCSQPVADTMCDMFYVVNSQLYRCFTSVSPSSYVFCILLGIFLYFSPPLLIHIEDLRTKRTNS